MLISLLDYERMFKVIHAVLSNEKGNPAKACLWFNIFGAQIISDHYKLNPQVHCGLALYHVGEENDVITFGTVKDGQITSDSDHFHCWIEVNGWVIDFLSPLFMENSDGRLSLPPKMFQKQKQKMVHDINDLKKAGDFFLSTNSTVTNEHLSTFLSKIGNHDLASICSTWFVKRPKKIRPKLIIGDQTGKTNEVFLSSMKIRSQW